ncbi:hypothetical protein LPJ71_010904, partial [Coemansia sp. S17]
MVTAARDQPHGRARPLLDMHQRAAREPRPDHQRLIVSQPGPRAGVQRLRNHQGRTQLRHAGPGSRVPKGHLHSLLPGRRRHSHERSRTTERRCLCHRPTHSLGHLGADSQAIQPDPSRPPQPDHRQPGPPRRP